VTAALLLNKSKHQIMTTKVVLNLVSRGFILFSALSLAYVAVLAMFNPQSVMDLVGVKLPNTDSISSIRGIYGGVGITIVLLLCYLAFFEMPKGLVFLTIFWGSYAISRLITGCVDGPLGNFGTTWLYIESFFCFVGIVLLIVNRRVILK
jgi:hypothetical protein